MRKFLDKKGKIVTTLTDSNEGKSAPAKVERVSLERLDELAERSLGVLETQLSKLESSARTSTFTFAQFEVLKSMMGAIAGLKRSLVPAGKKSSDREEKKKAAELEKELSSMGKDEVMGIMLPYLESLGIDINEMPLRPKEKKNDTQTLPNQVYQRGQDRDDGGA